MAQKGPAPLHLLLQTFFEVRTSRTTGPVKVALPKHPLTDAIINLRTGLATD